MADKPAALEQAAQQALSRALETLQRQVDDVQSSFAEAREALEAAHGQEAGERFINLVTTLVRVQTTGAALTASIEAVLRFVGVSAQWTGMSGSAPAVVAPAEAPAPVEEPPVEEAAPAEAGAPVEEEAAVEATNPLEQVAVEEAPAEEEEPAATEPEAVAVEEAAPAEAPAPAEPVDIESLPADLKKLHKKAARFARVAVQELFMYKKDEVTNGRENKDLYQRFKDEIDKSKALYDKRFEKIAEHNIDYLYDELVRVLAENDASALGDYPYAPRSS